MTPSAFVRGCAPGATRVVRSAWRLVGVTAITTCTRLDAASVSAASASTASAGALRSAEAPITASFTPPPGTYDAVMAQRGKAHFTQYCAECHVKQKRATSRPAKKYVRLRYLGFDTAFFADGRARTLEDVVEHYDGTLQMRLSKAQQGDLVEYLKSH